MFCQKCGGYLLSFKVPLYKCSGCGLVYRKDRRGLRPFSRIVSDILGGGGVQELRGYRALEEPIGYYE